MPHGPKSMKTIIFFIGGPLLLIAAGFIVAGWFELSPRNSILLTQELERLRSGGDPKDATEEVHRMCRLVTGIDYDQCKWSH